MNALLAQSFVDWLRSMDARDVRYLVILAGLVLAASIWAIAWAWQSVRRSEHRTRLTAALLQRNLRTEEIERVLEATYGKAAEEPGPDSSPDPEVRIVKQLSDCSYDGNDIEKILAAARTHGPIDESAVRMIEAMSNAWTEAAQIAAVLRNRGAQRAPRIAPGPGTDATASAATQKSA